MMSISAVTLSGYSLVRISGAERTDFLQGQLTQDIDQVSNEQSELAGWASAKGRLLMVTQVMAWQESYYLPVPTDISEALIQRFRMFVLRAKVDVELSDLPVIGLLGLEAEKRQNIGGLIVDEKPGATASNDEICISRFIGDPSRAWLIGAEKQTRTIIDAETLLQPDDKAWELSNIQAGLPVISQATSEAFVPQMVNLDLIGGINFTKGCYVGQEIVARTQNLGRIKRRMYRFGANSTLSVVPGSNLYGPQTSRGKIVATAKCDSGTELLAVIPIKESATQWFADEDRRQPLENLGLPYSIPE